MWAIHRGEEPSGKVYEEHKLILSILEQEPCKDAVIAEINKQYKWLMQTKHTLHDIDIAFDAIKCVAVRSVQPSRQWILVSEGLPEEKQSVLVWCPQYKNIYCAYLEKEQWWIFGAFVQIVPNEVIAWMPLPKPYKADKESSDAENSTSSD